MRSPAAVSITSHQATIRRAAIATTRAHAANAPSKRNACLRAESILAVVPTLERVASAPGGITLVTGPPGSGKTSALAARAVRLAQQGPVYVICSHTSGVRVFERHAQQLGAARVIRVATAPEHCISWLRTHYALAGVHPDVAAGGEAAS